MKLLAKSNPHPLPSVTFTFRQTPTCRYRITQNCNDKPTVLQLPLCLHPLLFIRCPPSDLVHHTNPHRSMCFDRINIDRIFFTTAFFYDEMWHYYTHNSFFFVLCGIFYDVNNGTAFKVPLEMTFYSASLSILSALCSLQDGGQCSLVHALRVLSKAPFKKNINVKHFQVKE